MVDTEDAAFAVEQIFGRIAIVLKVNGVEMILERRSHHNAADVVDEASDVIRFVIHAHDRAGQFASEDRSGDAMLPKLAPAEFGTAGELLEIFNDRSDDSELANLAHAEVKDAFLDAVHRIVQAVIDRVHEAEESRREARVAANDFRNLGGEAVISVQ